ncbi:Zn-ribbon domain-containing OB-fold protein [Comamonadaceae bacterium G21597-S1]|nr:Zn-ribbon domain-containing OB-fold protein [Comamonadaceae bacterium G21597-S1]
MNAKTSLRPKAIPVPTPITQPFWDGTRAGELRLQRCSACGAHHLYPRFRCPACGADALTWVRASGRARLHSYVISHIAAPGWENEAPYVIAVVKLHEGPTMLSNLVGIAASPDALTLDMPLEVVFETRGDAVLPLFRAINASGVPS